jgi:hypothetical protein
LVAPFTPHVDSAKQSVASTIVARRELALLRIVLEKISQLVSGEPIGISQRLLEMVGRFSVSIERRGEAGRDRCVSGDGGVVAGLNGMVGQSRRLHIAFCQYLKHPLVDPLPACWAKAALDCPPSQFVGETDEVAFAVQDSQVSGFVYPVSHSASVQDPAFGTAGDDRRGFHARTADVTQPPPYPGNHGILDFGRD